MYRFYHNVLTEWGILKQRAPHLTFKGENRMHINSRRRYFGKFATIAAAFTGAPILLAQQARTGGTPAEDRSRRSNHIHNGIYYFSGTGSNDGYPKEDHVFVTDPFEKHVVRTMDALKKS